jgi:hypothetical protein
MCELTDDPKSLLPPRHLGSRPKPRTQTHKPRRAIFENNKKARKAGIQFANHNIELHHHTSDDAIASVSPPHNGSDPYMTLFSSLG